MSKPHHYTPEGLAKWDVQVEVGGRWVLARPVPYRSLLERFRRAWWVFTYRADVLIWPGQEKP